MRDSGGVLGDAVVVASVGDVRDGRVAGVFGKGDGGVNKGDRNTSGQCSDRSRSSSRLRNAFLHACVQSDRSAGMCVHWCECDCV